MRKLRKGKWLFRFTWLVHGESGLQCRSVSWVSTALCTKQGFLWSCSPNLVGLSCASHAQMSSSVLPFIRSQVQPHPAPPDLFFKKLELLCFCSFCPTTLLIYVSSLFRKNICSYASKIPLDWCVLPLFAQTPKSAKSWCLLLFFHLPKSRWTHGRVSP